MKLNKIAITTILTVFIILSAFTNVYAEDISGVVTVTKTSDSSYEVGSEIILNVSIDFTGMDGVNVFYADVNYNKEIFKYEGVINIKSGWTVLNQSDNVYIEERTGKDEKGQLCQLKFKVLKNDVDATIKLESINAAGRQGEVHYLYDNVNEPEISFKGVSQPTTPTEPETPAEPTPDTPAEPTPDTPGTPTTPAEPTPTTPETPATPTKPSNTGNTGSSNNKGTTSSTNKTTTTTRKTTTAPGKIPQTGTMELGMIFLAIGVDISIIMLIRYRKANRRIDR